MSVPNHANNHFDFLYHFDFELSFPWVLDDFTAFMSFKTVFFVMKNSKHKHMRKKKNKNPSVLHFSPAVIYVDVSFLDHSALPMGESETDPKHLLHSHCVVQAAFNSLAQATLLPLPGTTVQATMLPASLFQASLLQACNSNSPEPEAEGL